MQAPKPRLRQEQRTILRVRAVLGAEGFKSFRFISRRFQMGKMTAREYYDSVKKTLPPQHLDELAPPLFVLLPNEKDRGELMQLHAATRGRRQATSSRNVVREVPRTARSPYQHPVHVESSSDALAEMLTSQVAVTSTRLVLMAMHNDAHGTRNMLSLGVSPNDTNSLGQSALHVAARHLNYETMVALLDYGADANGTNKVTGSTPLHCAVQCAESTNPEQLCTVSECTALLLQHGADLQRVDRSGRRAFDYAAERWGQVSVQQWFKGAACASSSMGEGAGGGAGGGAVHADTNGADGDISKRAAAATALSQLHGYVTSSSAGSSAGSNLESVLEELFSNHERKSGGVSRPEGILNAVDGQGYTALHLAVESGSEHSVSLLLRYGAATSTINHLGSTPLHSSVSRGELGVVRLLLEAGADPCARELLPAATIAATAATAACKPGVVMHEDCGGGGDSGGASKSSGKGGGGSGKGDSGTTPLHLAAEEGDPAVLKLLLEFGAAASMGMKDDEGCTPLDVAVDCDAEDCAVLLLRQGQQLQQQSSTMSTPAAVAKAPAPPAQQQSSTMSTPAAVAKAPAPPAPPLPD
jgi:ankyrin repeat protein